MNLSPSLSRGLFSLQLCNHLSQGVCHATLALSSCPGHPARLLRSDNGECDELDTTSCQHGMNAPLIFPSLESNAKRAILSARAPLYRCDRKLSVSFS
ncbi:unnamed protein product [Penicillium salamii]|uniref:Uncharacterized protein n=1 Tax=Penicillium salamii TaxID=1612424 RepID=A0A9W4NIN6_9EURO|nr:unnamed protein product [Penicillium salamii]CAG8007877.1 unnamed protein product [Penicillium salamii]CAG8031705.1 unnamed protein product [Penicillium salamii]CAG8268108.1 unnamed protein product [Penicillium salamii]CAG8370184.1 unnamed protein product [Penicillium salamii]